MYIYIHACRICERVTASLRTSPSESAFPWSLFCLSLSRCAYVKESWRASYINDVLHLNDASCVNHTSSAERWGAGVETQKNVRGEIGGWGRVPFDEPYAPSLSTIYDGA